MLLCQHKKKKVIYTKMLNMKIKIKLLKINLLNKVIYLKK